MEQATDAVRAGDAFRNAEQFTQAEPTVDVPGFEIIELIAQGGMGRVYKARQTALKRIVALKMIRGDRDPGPTARARFQIEAEAVASLRHPHIVQVHESGEHDGSPWFALEFISGGSFADRLKRDGPMQPVAAAALVRKVADAMTVAHAAGIVHRDLKPENILLAEEEPKVADFGIARFTSADSTVTQDFSVIGTPAYMSPEQAAGRSREAGPPADIWAIGAILYESLTGRSPFAAGSKAEIFENVLHRDPERPRSRNRRIPIDLETICLKCLEKDPARRYTTAAALAADLRAFLERRPISARPVGPVERTMKWCLRHPGRAAAVAASLLAAVAVAFGLHLSERRSHRAAGRQLVRTFLNDIEPSQVNEALHELRPYRDVVTEDLIEAAREPIESRPGLNARVALLEIDPSQAGELSRYAAQCRTPELVLLRDALKPHPAATADLWPVLTDRASPPRARIQAACILAPAHAGDQRWADLAAPLVDSLLAAQTGEYGAWSEALVPVGPTLAPRLLERYTTARERIADGGLELAELAAVGSDMARIADLGPAYLANDPELLTEAALVLAPQKTVALSGASLPRLEREFEATCCQHWRTRPFPDAPNDSPLAAVVGFAFERGATVPVAVQADLARRQAAAAIHLDRLGRPDRLMQALAFRGDSTLRSYVVAFMPQMGVSAARLWDWVEREHDSSLRRSALIALGDHAVASLARDLKDLIVEGLKSRYRTDPDPGVHSAIRFVLRRWGFSDAVAAMDREFGVPRTIPADRDWFVNRSGQTFAIIRDPKPFLAGSPPSEPERCAILEPLRSVTIRHNFAIATHETTTRDFRLLISNHQPNERYSRLADGPAVAVSWYRAAEYCNRLSEAEGIPAAEWCYEPNDAGSYESGMRLKTDYLERTGYRLPTDFEWEFAARAGTTTARHFGQPDDLLAAYEWHLLNTQLMSRSTGSLRPNDLGLFDVLGNAFEWTNDRPLSHLSKGNTNSDLVVIDTAQRVYRGGSFGSTPPLARSATRIAQLPSQRVDTCGFRLARTIRESLMPKP